VALGAASYGLVLAGKGVRIRGGTARAYYVGVEGEDPRRRHGVCLIPFGVEEGDEVAIEDRAFHLVTDRPVSFPLFSSTAPLGHDAGAVVEITDDVFLELPPLYTVLSSDRRRPGTGGGGRGRETVEVRLGARLTELGTLQLWCASQAPGKRWDLEFSLRGVEEGLADDGGEVAAAQVGDTSLEVDAEQQERAAEAIRAGFRPRGRDDQGPRALIKELEGILAAERLAWPGALIRRLWEPLWGASGNRKQSPDHESSWFNLAGILLRPGFGDPLDPGRIDKLWSVFRGGMHYEDQLWCRIGWWVLWRRVSGGLERGQQLELSNKLAPSLLSGAALKAAGKAGRKGRKGKGKGKKGKKGRKGGDGDGPSINRQELAEMWRAVASLERVPAASKEGLGDVALRNAVAGRGDFAYWALGRFGARIPLYGPVQEVIARGKVEGWLDRLLGLDWAKHRGIALAVAQMARLCGDPGREIDDALRTALVERMRATECPESLISLLLEVKVLQESERGQMYGDALPAGLRLVTESG
jgi:hypothetical protein